MQNPIISQISKTNPMISNIGQIKNMMNLVQNSADPNAMLNQMAAQNPQLSNVMEIVNQNGGDPKTAFYNLARQRGVDPDSILNMLR